MHKQGSEIYTPLNSSYKSILIFVFQNRGRFSDAKRPEDMDDTFGSNFIHTGIGIERDRLLFSEAQKAEKTKYSGGETRGNNFLNHNIGKIITPRKDRIEKTSSPIAEFEDDENISVDKKNLSARADKHLRYNVTDISGTLKFVASSYNTICF